MKINAVSIDDERIQLSILEDMAQKAGIEVRSFQNPMTALSYIQNYPVDLVFVDYLMPDMDGITLVRHARLSHPELISVMITSVDDERLVKLQALKEGVNLFLTKPVDIAEFSLCTQNLIRLYKSRQILQERVEQLEKDITASADLILEHKFGLW